MMWRFDRFGDAIAVRDEYGSTLTYRELARESQALCAAAGGRCLVFSLCRNTIGSLLGYVGLIEGGVADHIEDIHLLANGLFQVFQYDTLFGQLVDDGLLFVGAMPSVEEVIQ